MLYRDTGNFKPDRYKFGFWNNSRGCIINNLKVEKLFEGTETIWRFSGSLNEHAELPALENIKSTYLAFNLEKIQRANSIGISKWIAWLDGAKNYNLVFKRIPVHLVEILAHVNGFIPQGAKVASFYVPYIDNQTEQSEAILFIRDKHFDRDGIYPPPRIKHSESGVEMELDVMPGRYFAFLDSYK